MNATKENSLSMPEVTDVSADMLQSWMNAGDAVLVDCREDFEHAAERIEGAVLHPLSVFSVDKLRDDHAGKRVVFHCQSGKRSTEAARRFGQRGEAVFQLAGGIEQWKAAGRPVIQPESAPRIPIMRQVQIVAGALVATGVGLGVAVSPWFLIVPAFVGCGLMFAGISGWCGMAKLLAVLPWNR